MSNTKPILKTEVNSLGYTHDIWINPKTANLDFRVS